MYHQSQGSTKFDAVTELLTRLDFKQTCTYCNDTGLNSKSKRVFDSYLSLETSYLSFERALNDREGMADETLVTEESWSESLTEDELDVLSTFGDIQDLTHVKIQGIWSKRSNYKPTHDELQAWNKINPLTNMPLLVETRCARLGILGNCSHCE